MWHIENLESKEYLAYNIICGYIWYNEPKGYVVLEFTIGYLGLYALRYYYRLEIKYYNYYHCHQITRCGHLTFTMTPTSEVSDHVVS
jgi:hypothetical protein